MTFPGITRRRGLQGLAGIAGATALVAGVGLLLGLWLAIAVSAGFLLYAALLLAGRLRALAGRIDTVRRSVEATQGLYHVLGPTTLLAPTTDWSSSPAYLKELVDVIRDERPSSIVECGGGHSTVVAALMARREGLDCRITVLEHQELFAADLRRQMEQHGVADSVHVITAPLSRDGEGNLWYDPSGLANLERVDLVLVDGPPGFTCPRAREPVLRHLALRLSSKAVVILDDTNRTDERHIVESWQRDFGATVLRRRSDDNGVVVLRLP